MGDKCDNNETHRFKLRIYICSLEFPDIREGVTLRRLILWSLECNLSLTYIQCPSDHLFCLGTPISVVCM